MGSSVTRIIFFIFLILNSIPNPLPAQTGSRPGDTAAITMLLAKARKAPADSAINICRQAISIAESNLKKGRFKGFNRCIYP